MQGYKILYSKIPKKAMLMMLWPLKFTMNKIEFNCNKTAEIKMLKIRKDL